MGFGTLQDEPYDLVVVGTGFASSFFLLEYLAHAPPTARVAVLERGRFWDHAERVERRSNTPFPPDELYRQGGTRDKPWNFTVAFGGGTNCWWSNAPRMLPADFEMKSRYGVGRDWPFAYEDLAPFYARAEAAMSISGPDDLSPYPRANAYPQPPHSFNAPEQLLKAAYPSSFFAMPTGRARVATGTRGVCCANATCRLCPVDAKFTVENGLMHVYEDPRVVVQLDSRVLGVDVAAGIAQAVVYWAGGTERRVAGDLFMLGANALFNPVILAHSGREHPLLGRRLHEQVGVTGYVMLDGVESFQGSTSVTGIGYMLYDDDARRKHTAAVLLETWNAGLFRTEPGKWLNVLPVRAVIEDLPLNDNVVEYDPLDVSVPVVNFHTHSDYAQKALDRLSDDLDAVFSVLPVEYIEITPELEATESHIQGTHVMGKDAETSVVDANGVDHSIRNLVVLGSGNFPTGAPANPSLTIAAHALRSADALMGQRTWH